MNIPGKIAWIWGVVLLQLPLAATAMGPRRKMDSGMYLSLHDSLWSSWMELKIVDKRPVFLVKNRLQDEHGNVVFDPGLLPGAVQPAILEPTFASDPRDLRARRARIRNNCHCELGDLANYYRVRLAGSVADRKQALVLTAHMPDVEVAYPVSLPVQPPQDIPPTTPDFSGRQGYFSPAPGGIDVPAARLYPGGKGEGVMAVDIEYNWHPDHEDLGTCTNALVPNAGQLYEDEDFAAHGTAVLGILFAGDNGYGVTGSLVNGICRFAPSFTYNYGYNVARGIDLAHTHIRHPGLILLEAQEAGPNFNPDTYGGMVPVEYIPATYDAIRLAVADGVVVIEAGANGWENLDDTSVYGDMFDRTVSDSGAIMVGAGTPPSSPPARSREWYSNYGSRMDVQGWGSHVTTCGYGDLFAPGGDINQFYTDHFAGTSSASPIVTSAAGLLLGIARAVHGHECTDSGQCETDETCDTVHFSPGWCVKTVFPDPLRIRWILTETGTPQGGDISEHIGPLPNLGAAIEFILGTCGNGVLETGEECDDGNADSGDGCSADCFVETGWVCEAGSACSAICGDGLVVGDEECDDGNLESGDGCSESCQMDEGWYCEPGLACWTVCGDGIAAGEEECDDGNLEPGDGCSEMCTREKKEKASGCSCSAGSVPATSWPFLSWILFAGIFAWRRLRFFSNIR